MKSNRPDDCIGKGGGYLRVVHVGDIGFAVDIELVDRRSKCCTHLSGRAREIYNICSPIDGVDLEALRLEPAGNGLHILRIRTVCCGKLSGGEELTVVRRGWIGNAEC